MRADGPAFQRASLQLLGYDADRVLDWTPESSPCAIEHLILPALRGNSLECSPRSMNWLRTRFLAACGVDATTLSLSDATRKIYIGRKMGGWRFVENQGEVEEFLSARGFENVQAENLSFADQIRLFASARLIVGMHGAGLANILFAPRAHLVELMGGYGDGAYYNIASAFKQPYTLLNCNDSGDNIVVDLKQLEICLRDIEAKTP